MSPTLYLARHATPDWDRKDIRYDIPPGPPLVRQGEQEAESLAVWLAGRGIRQLYASPMLRAQQTATIVSEVLGLAIITTPDIVESRKGETYEAILTRMSRFYAQLQADGSDGAVAAVSHGFPIEVLLRHLGLGEERMAPLRQRFDHRNVVPCAGVWEIAPVGCNLAFTPELPVMV